MRRLFILCALAAGCAGGPADIDPGADALSEEDRILQAYVAEFPDLPHVHHQWHGTHAREDADYGSQFLQFHRDLVGAYQAWRAQKGEPPLLPWDPGTPLPPRMAHAGRVTSDPSAVDPLCRVPSWLTMKGGTERALEYAGARLDEFTSSDQLGSVIDGALPPGWHSRVHMTIGGDMAAPHRVPLDPAFWGFHQFIDDLWREWERATAPTE